MRTWVVGICIAAGAVGVSAQETTSNWRYFEPEDAPIQAGVVAPDGAQLILKCDKPGKGSVFAVVVSPNPLVPPSQNPFVLPTEVRFDEGAPQDSRWRYSGNSAIAVNTRGAQAFAHFMNGLPTASKLRVRMYVERGRTIEVNFDVTGAQEAVARVFESCRDDVPG